jgi:hypothetical protein
VDGDFADIVKYPPKDLSRDHLTLFIHRRFTLSPNNLLGFAIGRFALDAAA